MCSQFANQKASALKGVDLSRKGSVDAPIGDLVQLVNSLPQYFTTSSCSGRIVVLAEDSDDPESIVKEGCKWIHVTHDKCNPEEILDKLDATTGDLTFKFEAFVLHVQCRSLDDAQKMLSCGVQAGFRNSGISLKARKSEEREWPKIMVAIRSTHSIEAPLSSAGRLLVDEDYIEHISARANKLMEENLRRIKRFHDNLTKCIGR